MTRIIESIVTASLLVFALCATACSANNTSIEQSWQPPRGTHADLHRVVTVMLARDITVRRTAEDDMAQRLRSAGVDAVPGYTVLRDQDYGDPEAAKAKLKASGFDGAIAMRLVSREEHLEYVPGSFGGYWGGWSTYSPGYLQTQTVVRVETAAYSLVDDSLVYSALSRTTDPKNLKTLIADVTSTNARALEKHGVVVATLPQPAHRA